MQSEFRVLLAVIVIRMATIASLVVAQGCARPELNAEVTRQAGTDPAQLWIEPADLESRDLFFGYGGRASVPDPDDAYRVVGVDKTGHSQGYELEDSQHRLWRAKVGEEAQSEVVVSRVLWAIGYHQPTMHYLKGWRIGGGAAKEAPARFRLDSDHEVAGSWGWGKENPFYGTRPLHGLIVANLLLNNWDFGVDQNRVYRVKNGDFPEIRYVVQDVGGSLGKSTWIWGTRNDIEDFESQGFVKRVRDGRAVFDYRSRHRLMVNDIPVEDIVWACRLLDRLSERQLRDAFRAADYAPEVTQRYIQKIRLKIREGLALRPESAR